MSKMTNKKLAFLALAGLGALTSGSALASSMTVDSKGGIEVFELEGGKYWFKIGGRLLFDQAFFNVDETDINSFPSGARIRSARLTFKGGVTQDWVYKVDFDWNDRATHFVNSTSGGVLPNINEAYIGYEGCKNLWFAVGQLGIPFGLENWASVADLPFMEPSLATSAFAPQSGLGLYAEWYGDMFTASAMLYEPRAGSFQYGGVLSDNPGVIPTTGPFGSTPGSDPLSFAARVTFSPVHDNYTVYHAGVSGRWDSMHEHSNFLNYMGSLEVQSRQTPFLTTNIPPNSAKSDQVYGLELAGRWGPMLLQGEYYWAQVNRDDLYPALDQRNPGGNLDYHGYYVEALYVLTGETREYDFDGGTFGGVKPKCRKGAWEVGVRHSFVDLLDRNLDALPLAVNATPGADGGFVVRIPGVDVGDLIGSAHSTTIGLTWFVNNNVKFMANYVRMDLPNIDVDSFGLRAQVTW